MVWSRVYSDLAHLDLIEQRWRTFFRPKGWTLFSCLLDPAFSSVLWSWEVTLPLSQPKENKTNGQVKQEKANKKLYASSVWFALPPSEVFLKSLVARGYTVKSSTLETHTQSCWGGSRGNTLPVNNKEVTSSLSVFLHFSKALTELVLTQLC